MEKLNSLFIGGGGLSASIIAPEVVSEIDSNPSNIVQVIVQIIIGIATLVGLFRKKNNNS